jgi:hypothetical protein
MIRAKMYLESITHTTWGTQVALRAVTKGEENKDWSAATPTGTLNLTIKNEKAAERFKLEDLGSEFYVDITPAPATD